MSQLAKSPVNTARNVTTLRHHCEKSRDRNGKEDKLLTGGRSGDGIFSVVVVKREGITCRALIDSGAGNSYASGNSLIN